MSEVVKGQSRKDCDAEAFEHFMNSVKLAAKEIKEFNFKFTEFREQQKKIAKDLCTCVSRYNILDAGPPCIFPLIHKEEMLEEILSQIQEKTTTIQQSLKLIKEKFDKITKLQKILEKQSYALEWNSTNQPLIKGNIRYLPSSEYLEDIADILFQYEVIISCMAQYFDALSLQQPKSYENLMNSISISSETVDLVNEFIIKSRI